MAGYDLIFNKNTSLQINEVITSYYFSDAPNFIDHFPNFNRINIIVGANNSGKSRFMRYFMTQGHILGVKNLLDTNKCIDEYNIKVDEFNKNVVDSYLQSTSGGYDQFGNNASELRSAYSSNRLNQLDKNAYNVILSVIENNKEKLSKISKLTSSRVPIKNDFISAFSDIDDDSIKTYSEFKRYYIPTLRTAHSLFEANKKIEKDIYLDTLNKYYELNGINVEVFTGIHLHKEILNARNAKKHVRKSFESFEKFISRNFFGGKEIDIVAEFNKDDSLAGENHSEIISVHIEGEQDRYLYQLGDGIQAIIILMYKIFMAEPNSFIYIDEPELNLHPGMQRLFLDQIYFNKDLKDKELTYVISTHSNHFLDLTLEKDDVSIYTFSPRNIDLQEKQFIIKNVNSGDNSLLRSLGVNNSSVFMANCSIWVEGISDRNYIKAFLKAYVKNLSHIKSDAYRALKEDIDFAFFEYAGSNIDHYIFNDLDDESARKIEKEIKALALSNKIFLLADSDLADGKTAKGKKLKKLEAAKKDNFTPKIIWDVREIENLLTPQIWKNVLINFCNKDLLITNREKIQKKIDIAISVIDHNKYKTKYIGEYLNQINLQLGKIDDKNVFNQSVYEKRSDGSFGTFIPKRQLSEFVLNEDFGWEIFKNNKSIIELTEEIYRFITTS